MERESERERTREREREREREMMDQSLFHQLARRGGERERKINICHKIYCRNGKLFLREYLLFCRHGRTIGKITNEYCNKTFLTHVCLFHNQKLFVRNRGRKNYYDSLKLFFIPIHSSILSSRDSRTSYT